MKTSEPPTTQSPQKLRQTTHDLLEALRERDEKIEQQALLIVTLYEQLRLMYLRYFGRSSEKNSDEQPPDEPTLFDEAAPPQNITEIQAVESTIVNLKPPRKKAGRKPLPKELPRVRRIHDLPDAEKTCACGHALTKIGEDTTEQLDYIPARIQVIEHVKLKYACKSCEEKIKTARTPLQPIPGSIASPGLLAHVAVGKYADHLPLYRQESIFQRIGVDIARNTLSHWMIKSSDLLLPLYKLLQAEIISYPVAFADETRVQVLKEPERSPETGSYMWCFIGGAPGKRSILYAYDPGRAHTVIEDTLEDFSGYLHCDGYGAYDTYASDHPVELVGCWMHARRKFIEVTKLSSSTDGLANKVVEKIGKLYAIEKEMKHRELSSEHIKEHRQTHATPILKMLQITLAKYAPKVLPKSPLGKAIHYGLNQWTKLTRYLEDGRLAIDNGRSERAIKPFVIGRKNWLFSDSVAGVKAGQIIYSIIETCRAHKRDPCTYLRYTLAKLPTVTTLEALEALLPYNLDREVLSQLE